MHADADNYADADAEADAAADDTDDNDDGMIVFAVLGGTSDPTMKGE